MAAQNKMIMDELVQLRKTSQMQNRISMWNQDESGTINIQGMDAGLQGNIKNSSRVSLSDGTEKAVHAISQSRASVPTFQSQGGGYDPGIFIEPPSTDFLCVQCQQVMKDPFILDCCEKKMCKRCFNDSNADTKCPTCGNTEDNDGRLSKKDKKMILNLQVKCNMQDGCQWQGVLADLDTHVHDSVQNTPHQTATNFPEPIAPRDVTVTAHDSTSIILSWKIEKDPSRPVENYVVMYCDADEIDNWIEYPEKATNETLVVENLEMNMTYFFKVKAVYANNENACSKSSKPANLADKKINPVAPQPRPKPRPKPAERKSTSSLSSNGFKDPGPTAFNLYQTADDSKSRPRPVPPQIVPRKNSASTKTNNSRSGLSVPGQPRNLIIYDDGEEIELAWSEPASYPEEVSQYIISIQQENNDPIQQQTNSINTVFKMQKLQPATMYTFQVFAETMMGEKSPPSKTLIHRTKCLMPGPPSKLELLNRQKNGVSIKWKKPKKYPENVEAYKILCYELLDPQLRTKKKIDEIIVESKEPFYTVKNLTPQVKYVLGLQAVSQGRETDEIFSDVIETKRHVAMSPPSELEIQKVGATNVFLKWNPPLNSEYVQGYSIQFRPGDTYNWEEFQQVAASTTTCEVDDLVQGNCYVFRVRSDYDKLGSSEWIESEKKFTKKLSAGIPGRPKCKSVETTSVDLYWEKPENDEYVKKYEVVCYDADKSEMQKKETSKPQEHITFHNLAPNSQYYFKVRAYCSNDQYTSLSKFSKPVFTMKFLPTISGQPKGGKKTSNSISLKWKLSCDQNEVMRYAILLRCPELTVDDDWEQIETQNNKPEFTVTDLDPDTGYVFKVMAKSKMYKDYGPESQVSELIRTTPMPPSPPVLNTRTNNSVSLTWTTHKKLAKQISFYNVKYMSEHSFGTGNWETYPKKFPKNEATIEQLQSGSHYCFMVVGYFKGSDADCSIETEPSEWIKTICPLPSPPGEPLAIEVTEDMLFLNWAKPKQNSQFVSYYNVYATHGQNQFIAAKEITDEAVQITNLNPNTKYKFTVEAVNADGKSAFSKGIPITTEKGLPGQPGQPYILQVTDNMVKVAWEKPKQKCDLVSQYIVSYKHPGDRNWMTKVTKSPIRDLSMEVTGLQHSTKYLFMITPCTEDGDQGIPSELSEPVVMKSSLPSAPGKPKGQRSTPDSITLKWDRPQEHFESIAYYEISFYEDDQHISSRKKIHARQTIGTVEQLTIEQLKSEKDYFFYVTAITESGDKSDPSIVSDLVTNDVTLATKFLPHCTKISQEGATPNIYLLPKEEISEKESRLHKYEIRMKDKPFTQGAFKLFGAKSRTRKVIEKEKVLMLVGATGSGKSTLVNGMINYIMRVRFGDHFRLKLVHETVVTQTQSVTSEVSAYTIQTEAGFELPYNFTIVDTPGFGDTAGIEQDQKITGEIKKFFNMKHGGITHLDGIGFVCQAGCVRLTPTQRYIFDSIFAMFGHDVKNNIFVLCTFCDDDKPQVIDAVKAAEIPADKFYKFNNSALYSGSRSRMTESFWDLGTENFKNFFRRFEDARPVSLTLTKEVLQERENLETIVIGLQIQIQNGMNLINSFRKEIKILEENKSMIEQNKNFTYTVEEDTMTKVRLETGRYTTNCMKCNMTCHYPCIFADDEQKRNCAAMTNKQGEEDASCGVCPAKCHWSNHCNASFRLITERKMVTKEYKETLQKYNKAKDDDVKFTGVVNSLENEIDEKFEAVFKLVLQANTCTKKLDEIAFRSNHMNDVQYIELLIEAQQQEKKPGYQERIKHYRVLQERAKIIFHSTGTWKQAIGKRWWKKYFFDEEQ